MIASTFRKFTVPSRNPADATSTLRQHVRIGAAIALFLTAADTHAIALGDARSRSAIGEPLHGFVDVLMSPAEMQEQWQVKVLSGSPTTNLPLAINAYLRETRRGVPYIELRSDGALPRRDLAVRIKIVNADATHAVSRHYSLHFRPSRSFITRRTTRSKLARRGSESNVVANGHYGPIRAGENLWTIAMQHTERSNAGEWMNEVLALNPHAFVDQDITRLKQNVILQLPGNVAQTAAPETPVETSQRIPASSEPTNKAASSGSQKPSTPTPRGANAIPTAALRDPELAQRLARLDEKFKAIRSRYLPQVPSPKAAVADQQLATQPARVTPTPPVRPVARATTTTSAAPSNDTLVTNTPVPNTDTTKDRSSRGPLLLGAALLIIFAALAFVWRTRRRPTLAPTSVHSYRAEAEIRREVALKAERNKARTGYRSNPSERIEIQALEEIEQEVTAGTVRDFEGPSEEDGAAEKEPLSATGDFLKLKEAEHQCAVDDHISNGQYAEAKVLLGKLITLSENNYLAKLRLAELHYILEETDNFIALAHDLEANHRNAMSDDEWQRLLRMGEILAPGVSLFGGLQAVGQ